MNHSYSWRSLHKLSGNGELERAKRITPRLLEKIDEEQDRLLREQMLMLAHDRALIRNAYLSKLDIAFCILASSLLMLARPSFMLALLIVSLVSIAAAIVWPASSVVGRCSWARLSDPENEAVLQRLDALEQSL
jgi:hypothetical protein